MNVYLVIAAMAASALIAGLTYDLLWKWVKFSEERKR